MQIDLVRGTGNASPNLVEFDYFPTRDSSDAFPDDRVEQQSIQTEPTLPQV
ncbi:MAG: hypothetical protein U1G07_23695 [Verrucomicrobiota bacterium]